MAEFRLDFRRAQSNIIIDYITHLIHRDTLKIYTKPEIFSNF
jgi:hypothetical protein